MQYKVGTIAVTPGLARVHGSRVYWKTRAGVTPGHLIKLANRPEFYEVAAAPTWEDDLGNSFVDLTAPYAGTTLSASMYILTRDFTPNYSVPELNNGDIDTAQIFTRAVRMIDTALGSILYGDTLIDTINGASLSKIDESVIDPDITRDSELTAAIAAHAALPNVHHTRQHSMQSASDHTGEISDTQHGVRAGGDRHSVAISGGANGFFSGIDKAKLDGIQQGARQNQTVSAGAGLTGGGSGDTILLDVIGGNGITVAADLVSVDFCASAPATVLAGTPTVGVLTTVSRGDHQHALLDPVFLERLVGRFSASNPAAVGMTPGCGAGTYAARYDHIHGLENALFNIAYPQDVAETPSVGTSSLLSRSDHVHRSIGGLLSDNPPNNVSATGQTAGTAVRASRWDHVHYHGALPGSTVTALHELAGTVAAGFMSGVDRLAMNILNGGPTSDASARHFHPTVSISPWDRYQTLEPGVTVTGTTLGNVMSFPFTPPSTGMYAISWYCECRCSNVGQGVRVRIRETAPTAQDYADITTDVFSITATVPNSGQFFRSCTGGVTVTVAMDVCSTTGGVTGSAHRARMTARKMFTT